MRIIVIVVTPMNNIGVGWTDGKKCHLGSITCLATASKPGEEA